MRSTWLRSPLVSFTRWKASCAKPLFQKLFKQLGVHGFSVELVATSVYSSLSRVLGQGRHGNDARVLKTWLLPQSPRDVVPLIVRQSYVQQDDVGAELPCDLQRQIAADRELALMAHHRYEQR